ncbi:hypothetical protein ZL58_14000 [Salmonella enterica subsp. enterica serovar Typhimurium]|nr:hypothetical protein [Salmonella enterica subsp. enterica serovar Typhimurium]
MNIKNIIAAVFTVSAMFAVVSGAHAETMIGKKLICDTYTNNGFGIDDEAKNGALVINYGDHIELKFWSAKWGWDKEITVSPQLHEDTNYEAGYAKIAVSNTLTYSVTPTEYKVTNDAAGVSLSRVAEHCRILDTSKPLPKPEPIVREEAPVHQDYQSSADFDKVTN